MWDVGSDAVDREWHELETPFNKTLYEVVSTEKGPYAIGDGGTLVANREGGDQHEWEIMLTGGPKTRANRLKGLTVTDDGKRLWMAGSSGALGCYDVMERRKFDYSSPHQMTSTWEGIAVSGSAGSEKGLVANGSGEVLAFQIDGYDVDWGILRKPAAKGASVAALAASPEGIGYAVDTSGNAFRTTDDDGWEDIGIVNAQVKFNDIYAGKNERVYVAAGDGRIYRYDDSYNNWTPIKVGKESLTTFDIYEDTMVVMGASGTIHQRVGDDRWEQVYSPTTATLYDFTLGYPDVAVGDSGTILQRPREDAHTSENDTSADNDQYEGRGENFDDDENQPQNFDGEDAGDTSPKNKESENEKTSDGSSSGSSSDGSSGDGSESGSSSGDSTSS